MVVVAWLAGCQEPGERFTREELEAQLAMGVLDDATEAIRDALVRGDLYDARRRAGQLAQSLPPLPEGAPDAEQQLRLALSRIRASPSLEQAAAALGDTARVCSGCHTATRASVTRPAWEPSRAPAAPIAAEMARHSRVVDQLWLGMIGPSDSELRGALDLLRPAPGEPAPPARFAAADQRVHALATSLAEAPAEQRPGRYAELLVACAGCHGDGRPPAVPRFHGVPMPDLDDDMEDHFFHALELQLHVMGGDLDRAHLAARKLETGSFEVPPVAEPYVAWLRTAAGNAARAESLREAAIATAEVAGACGSCHLATGGGPTDAISPPEQAPHMVLHVYGAWWMGYGLIAADERAWTQGADALAHAPLSAEIPPAVAGAEATVHELASRAGATTGWPARTRLWGELLAECASCHRTVGAR